MASLQFFRVGPAADVAETATSIIKRISTYKQQIALVFQSHHAKNTLLKPAGTSDDYVRFF